jgi:hypothetical protein
MNEDPTDEKRARLRVSVILFSDAVLQLHPGVTKSDL